jgi:hypothetical protein
MFDSAFVPELALLVAVDVEEELPPLRGAMVAFASTYGVLAPAFVPAELLAEDDEESDEFWMQPVTVTVSAAFPMRDVPVWGSVDGRVCAAPPTIAAATNATVVMLMPYFICLGPPPGRWCKGRSRRSTRGLRRGRHNAQMVGSRSTSFVAIGPSLIEARQRPPVGERR